MQLLQPKSLVPLSVCSQSFEKVTDELGNPGVLTIPARGQISVWLYVRTLPTRPLTPTGATGADDCAVPRASGSRNQSPALSGALSGGRLGKRFVPPRNQCHPPSLLSNDPNTLWGAQSHHIGSIEVSTF